MPAQIVMDSNGDSRYFFDASDAQALRRAEARYKALTTEGYRAVALGKRGQPGQLLTGFDENVEETLFVPHLVGG